MLFILPVGLGMAFLVLISKYITMRTYKMQSLSGFFLIFFSPWLSFIIQFTI